MARCMHCSKVEVQCCEQQDALYEQALQQRTLRALMPTHDASALTMCLLMACGLGMAESTLCIYLYPTSVRTVWDPRYHAHADLNYMCKGSEGYSYHD